jgi:peptidoglycan/LPS O-acetylase OafA/YrhL
MTVSAKRKNMELEALRAIALFFGIFQHSPILFTGTSPYPRWLSQNLGFWSGVDLFFVLSGFVITHSLRDLLEPSSTNKGLIFKVYLIKRVFRLMPGAWLWLALPVLIAFFMGHPAPDTMLHDAVAGALNVANFYYGYCFSEGKLGQLCSVSLPLGPYWSLSLEEQFYIVLPLLFIVFSRRSLTLLLLMLLTAGFFLTRPYFSYGWFFRVDGLAWGVLLAFFARQPAYARCAPLVAQLKPFRVLVLFLLLLAMMWFSAAGGMTLSGMRPVAPYAISIFCMATCALVFIASFDKGYLIDEGRIRRVLAAIGARSYSLYLVHLPLLQLSRNITSSLTLEGSGQMFAALALASLFVVVAGELTYRFVETPARLFGVALAERYRAASTKAGYAS